MRRCNKTTFGFFEANGYIVASIDGKQCVIDTGAKTCVGKKPFRLFGQTFETVRRFLDLDPETLSKYIGCHVDYLVGLDVLARWPWALDWSRKTLTFHLNGDREFKGVRVPLTKHALLGGTAGPGDAYWLDLNFRLGDRSLKALFDTGCALGGFLPRDEAGDAPDFRGYRDFFPSLGPFVTDLYRKRISVGERTFDLDFGVLPAEAPMSQKLRIIGNPILREGPATVDVPGGALYLAGSIN